MKPTVGRIVLFRHEFSNNEVEHPAIITKVHSDLNINLMVFLDNGNPEAKTSVTFNGDIKDPHAKYNWRWPPRDESLHEASSVPPSISPVNPSNMSSPTSLHSQGAGKAEGKQNPFIPPEPKKTEIKEVEKKEKK